jgi:hypothetical protein
MIEALAAIGSIGTVGALAAVIVLAFKLATATERAGKHDARAAALAVRMEVAIANAKTESNRADAEKERADALDAAIARCAADAVGPVDGSWERLLQTSAELRASAAGRLGAPAVRDAGDTGGTAEADRADPDRLLEPGE